MRKMNKLERQLDRQFRKYGGISLEYRHKCIGMLPEIFAKKIHIKKGFSSIEAYAAEFAGISHKQTRLTLNLEKRFAGDKPDLHEALVSGRVSVNKLARVAAIATAENQRELAVKAEVLSKRALQVYVQDVRNAQNTHIQNGLFEAGNESQSLPGQNSEQLNLSPEIEKKLLELQQKGIDINELLGELLQKREQEIEREKEKLAENETAKSEKRQQQGKKPSRYISVGVKRLLKKEHGDKCSIETCRKSAQEIHHTQRFSLAKTHNPHFMAPLCKAHHEIAQIIDLQYLRIKHQSEISDDISLFHRASLTPQCNDP